MIDLDAETVARLRRHRQRQDEEQTEWDADYVDHDLEGLAEQMRG